MAERKYRVAVIGCGMMGVHYVEAYSTFPDTDVVAIADTNPERRKAIGARFGVKSTYPDAQALLREIVPDIAAVVTPTKYYKDAVIACAEAGVKGVSADKPIGAVLADVDEMIETCRARGVVFAGGNVQRALPEVQEVARRIHNGEFGDLLGASLHGWGTEISGGGNQEVNVLRLFTDAEVDEVIAWATPVAGISPYALLPNTDVGWIINGRFHLTSGLDCPVFWQEVPGRRGVEVWSDDTMVRWNWAPPEIFQGYDVHGARKRIDPRYQPFEWSQFGYLGGSIRSFLAAVETGSELWISGHDLRQALEVAIAAKLSSDLGSVPVKLPLEDRSLRLYPSRYRWEGGGASGHHIDEDQTRPG